MTADIAGGVAQDSAGTSSTAAAQLSRTYDSTAPAVTAFSAATPAQSALATTW